MSFFDSALAFIEGVKSVIDASGAVQSTISDAISNGIERAFRTIRKPLEKSLMKVSLTLVSLLFMAVGVAIFIENFVPYHGLGYVAVGMFLGAIVLIFLRDNETG